MTVSPTSGTAATAAMPKAASTPLASLAGNFQDFLKLLMTQLQNQDPTSPMDTNQFTSQLVQFTSVEQQITTNGSLTKLIEATQGNEVLQSASLVGKQVQVTADHIPLQNQTAALQFTLAAPQPVSVGIFTETGTKLRESPLAGAAGSNGWTWDGRDSQGNVLPDGSYRVAVTDSAGSAVPFTVSGVATGMQRTGDSLNVTLGAQQAALSTVQAVLAQGAQPSR